MAILIKGMKMPISCERCPMLDWDLDYIKCKITDRHFKMKECWRTSRVPDCPLVEVPYGHGRLIDADALIERFPNNGWGYHDYVCSEIRDEILRAPTIIPADKEAKNDKP